MRDAAALRRGHLDDGLVRLDRDERLIRHDVIALVDVPGDDFRFLQAFPEVGQVELARGQSRSAELTGIAGGGNDAADRGHVMLLEARKRHDRIIAGDTRYRREQREERAFGNEWGDICTKAT